MINWKEGFSRLMIIGVWCVIAAGAVLLWLDLSLDWDRFQEQRYAFIKCSSFLKKHPDTKIQGPDFSDEFFNACVDVQPEDRGRSPSDFGFRHLLSFGWEIFKTLLKDFSIAAGALVALSIPIKLFTWVVEGFAKN